MSTRDARVLLALPFLLASDVCRTVGHVVAGHRPAPSYVVRRGA